MSDEIDGAHYRVKFDSESALAVEFEESQIRCWVEGGGL